MANDHTERCFERKRIRLEDVSYSDPSMIYFATLCARGRAVPFANESLARQVVRSLMWYRENGRLNIYTYCLMPDHLHMAISPKDPQMPLYEVIGDMKSYTTSRSWKLGLEGVLWQRSWYDHIARQDEDVLSICEYILQNPVRKGLIETWEEWPYSGMPDPLPL